jgi:peptidoglycan LD-endopeptidase LytH
MRTAILLFVFLAMVHGESRFIGNHSLQPREQSGQVKNNCCLAFNELNNQIRDSRISQAVALQQLQVLLPLIKARYIQQGGIRCPETDWVFPVQHYNTKAIGGVNGSGYVASGYKYFDGNRHAGHPAHDIFILDRNQDCLDDATKKPVNVLSMTGGIVVATETKWDKTSKLRGGNYIWIFDPSSDCFFYYAHNGSVFVEPGRIVRPGDTIATVGRTGLNASMKRSPTHLHFMELKIGPDCYPRPSNLYGILIRTKLTK